MPLDLIHATFGVTLTALVAFIGDIILRGR
jgi:hypothetical protein